VIWFSGNETISPDFVIRCGSVSHLVEQAPAAVTEISVEMEEKGKNYLHRERAFSTFRRHIGFAESIDTGKVSASMADGILEVKLPKLEPEPEKKRRKLTPE
jgi:hypothetical protein